MHFAAMFSPGICWRLKPASCCKTDVATTTATAMDGGSVENAGAFFDPCILTKCCHLKALTFSSRFQRKAPFQLIHRCSSSLFSKINTARVALLDTVTKCIVVFYPMLLLTHQQH
jgi:hypothetical protein